MKKVYMMLGLLVVMGAVAFIVNYDASGKGRHRAPAVDEPAAKLPAIEPARVHAIEISDAENRVRVARAGDGWVLPDKSNHPAVSQRVTDLLGGLQGLERAEVVSKSAASATSAAFGLEPGAAKRVTLSDQAGGVIADLWVGKADLSGERGIQAAGNFVRPEGGEAVYSHRKRLQHLVMPMLSMWLEGRMFVLEPKDVDEALAKAERVTVEFDDVPFTPGAPAETRTAETPRVRVVLQGRQPESVPDAPPPSTIGPTATTPPQTTPPPAKSWTIVEPAETNVQPAAPQVDQIVRSLLYARADDVAGADPTLAEYGFQRPFVEVEIGFSDGTTRRMRVGDQAPAPTEASRRGGTYRYAHVDGVPRVFLVNEYLLAAFRKKPEDLAPPAAQAPGTTPGVPVPIELPKDDAPETRK